MDSTLGSTPPLESPSSVSTYEPLPPLASPPIPPYFVSPPKLELEPLPDSLKYVFYALKRPYLSLYLLFYLVIKKKNSFMSYPIIRVLLGG